MTITQNGNTLTWDGTVTLTNATDITTGVATLMLTPTGGVGNLPVLAQGGPGLPPVFDSVSVTPLSAGATPYATLTTNSAGGSGVASHYSLTLGIPAGQNGSSYNSVQAITISGSPTGGSFTLSYGSQTATVTAPASLSSITTAVQTIYTAAGGSSANVTVTGSNPYYVAFSASPVITLTANGASLTGATVSVQGSYTLGAASDLDTVTTALADQYMIKWSATAGKFRYAAQPVGGTYQCTSFTAYSGTGATSTALGTLSIPAQPFNWVPRVSGLAIPSGTANTSVDLQALVAYGGGASIATGIQVGYGYGVKGSGSSAFSSTAFPVTLTQAFSATQTLGGGTAPGYGVVPSGQRATMYLVAKNTGTVGDTYTVPSTSLSFSVRVDPVPGSN